jgi:hypothetical protein
VRASLLVVFALASCRASSGPSSSEPPPPAVAAIEGGAPSDAGSPPPLDRRCDTDQDCAVARISPSGPYVCCPDCGHTPGSARWHAELQRYCGRLPTQGCPPLACPSGPTRAVCRNHTCEATGDGPDGGHVHVPEERLCLPALVCDAWAGCALIRGNEQDRWFVEEAERAERGSQAGVRSVCGDGGCVRAAQLQPDDVVCPAIHDPPSLVPPGYACALDPRHCRPR